MGGVGNGDRRIGWIRVDRFRGEGRGREVLIFVTLIDSGVKLCPL